MNRPAEEKEDEKKVVLSYSTPSKEEPTFAQTLGLYIAVFCATGVGLLLLALAVMFVLQKLGVVR